MKKTYMKPALEQVVIETENMIAESLASISFNDSNGTGSGSLINSGAQSAAMSKNNAFDLWGEDEE